MMAETTPQTGSTSANCCPDVNFATAILASRWSRCYAIGESTGGGMLSTGVA